MSISLITFTRRFTVTGLLLCTFAVMEWATVNESNAADKRVKFLGV